MIISTNGERRAGFEEILAALANTEV